jgi:nitroreductase
VALKTKGNATMEDLWSLLAARRHVAPRRLAAPAPDEDALARIFDAAAQAPDHGRLRPWRFVLNPARRRADLGEAFVQALVARDPGCDDAARTAAREKAAYGPCLLAAILVDEPGDVIPVDEKLISLGCALQNMLLAAQALGYGSGLASGGALDAPAMRALLGLGPHERAVCFVAFGTPTAEKPPRTRPRPENFVSSL